MMLVVKVPIAFPESRPPRPPLLRLRCEQCIAATIIRFIIETEKTPRCLPRDEKGVVNDASTLKLPPKTSALPLPLLLPLLLLLLLLLFAATKRAEERADEEKAIQFVSVTAQRRKKMCVFCVRDVRSNSLSLDVLSRALTERESGDKRNDFCRFYLSVSSRERIKNNGEGRAPGVSDDPSTERNKKLVYFRGKKSSRATPKRRHTRDDDERRKKSRESTHRKRQK